MPTSDQVTAAPVVTRPPNAVLGCRTGGPASGLRPRMQSTHCWPTGADRRQSGQAGRPQREQETYVSRPGCRKQVGTPDDAAAPSSGGPAADPRPGPISGPVSGDPEAGV